MGVIIMWFRYLIAFVDLGLSGIICYSCFRDDFRKNHSAFIGAMTITVAFLSSVILMWR